MRNWCAPVRGATHCPWSVSVRRACVSMAGAKRYASDVKRQETTETAASVEDPLDLGQVPDLHLTYPPGSKYLNPQHFYQVGVSRWLQRPPRPVSIAQMVQFSKNMTPTKLLYGANHVVEELTIRFAHRIRQMQLMPYRIMGHPELLRTYEQYVDSFEMLRQLGEIKTLEENRRLIDIGHILLQKHTQVLTNAISGAQEALRSNEHRSGDMDLLNELLRSLVTSRLSRRVLVQQQTALTEQIESGHEVSSRLGAVDVDCRIADILQDVEARAKENLAGQFGVSVKSMPQIIVEGAPEDLAATFPYIRSHFEFALGELIFNSLEACLRNNILEPINVAVSATDEDVLVRISDRGGGVPPGDLAHIWSLAKPLPVSAGPLTASELSEHQFYNLLFPREDLPDEVQLTHKPNNSKASHLGLGLALSRLYVAYWGGALEFHSLEGFGCDVLIRVSRTGSTRENLRLD